MTQLPDWLAHRARLSPERLALICGDARLSYAELDSRVSAVASRLQTLGVRGEAVAVLCRNGLAFALLAHAVPRAGALLVPLNTRLAPDEIRYQLRDVGARVLVYDGENSKTAMAVDGWQREASPIPAEACTETENTFEPIEPSPLELSATRAVIYTSGTTGTPKGVILTHGNFWYSAVGSALNLGIQQDDRWLAVLPLFHVGGLSILYRSVIYGTAAVVHERFDAADVNAAIDQEGITIVSLVSTMLSRLIDEWSDRPYPETLRCALLGGGPAPLPLLRRCAALDIPVVQTYGLTETTSQAATLAPDEALSRLGSAGKPLMTAEVRIGDDAKTGEAGEILVRGPIVSPGYIHRPTDITGTDGDGWLHTGDIGYLDGEGYLYVLDRRDDLIVSGGENVYPAEVEAVLAAHPAVREAGVFGVPHEEWGQVVAAAVVLQTGAEVDSSDLMAFCRERLAAYKTPRRLLFVDALPRNAGGKLMRGSLKDLTE